MPMLPKELVADTDAVPPVMVVTVVASPATNGAPPPRPPVYLMVYVKLPPKVKVGAPVSVLPETEMQKPLTVEFSVTDAEFVVRTVVALPPPIGAVDTRSDILVVQAAALVVANGLAE